jgi:hypothetical protein
MMHQTYRHNNGLIQIENQTGPPVSQTKTDPGNHAPINEQLLVVVTNGELSGNLPQEVLRQAANNSEQQQYQQLENNGGEQQTRTEFAQQNIDTQSPVVSSQEPRMLKNQEWFEERSSTSTPEIQEVVVFTKRGVYNNVSLWLPEVAGASNNPLYLPSPSDGEVDEHKRLESLHPQGLASFQQQLQAAAKKKAEEKNKI